MIDARTGNGISFSIYDTKSIPTLAFNDTKEFMPLLLVDLDRPQMFELAMRLLTYLQANRSVK
jgi:hypothetical protein